MPPRPREVPQVRHADPLSPALLIPHLLFMLRESQWEEGQTEREVETTPGRMGQSRSCCTQLCGDKPLHVPVFFWASVSPCLGQVGSVDSSAPPVPDIWGLQNSTVRVSLCYMVSV